MKLLRILIPLVAMTVVLASCLNLVEGYKTKNGKVYFHTLSSLTGTSSFEVEGADAASFKQLSDPRFGRDNNHVYMAAGIITDADPASFQMMNELNVFGMSRYARDKHHVFLEGNVIPGADPATFKRLKGYYAIDQERAYYDGQPFTTNTTTLSLIDEYYARDTSDIYLMGTALNVCSTKNFEFIFPGGKSEAIGIDEPGSDRWGRDGCHYFYGSQKMPSDDYDNITVFKGSMGIMKDSRTAYMRGRDIRFDVNGEKLLDTLDLATFTANRMLNCSDKFGPINVFCGRKEECD
ncbi:DKNYY domain-containing protein [Neolewinella persica]|uniref:DKNYY domain-containing protein n=1 Tax=Neolewinella persica TaxID=70998 RepID=UPI000A06FE13|nr:DKNYY domain-containing protein [Neolewinella persica]